jgi:hydroxymethylbilane synthase
MMETLTLGARGSDLALMQAELIRSMIQTVSPGLNVLIKTITTEGDSDRVAPLSSFGGRGAFVSAIETALVRHEIDAAVHSLKDVPSKMPEGLILAATPVREDPRDVLVTRKGVGQSDLKTGALIGTGSDRRSRQIGRYHPCFVFSGIRGNVETRVRKVDEGQYDGVILAAAGLKRLGLEPRITSYFDPSEVIPAPCQGIIGVECRADDSNIISIMKLIENNTIRSCADAERAFISTLGLGCHEPVAVYAVIEGHEVSINGYVYFKESGRELMRTGFYPLEDAVSGAVKLAGEFMDALPATGEDF